MQILLYVNGDSLVEFFDPKMDIITGARQPTDYYDTGVLFNREDYDISKAGWEKNAFTVRKLPARGI